MLAVGMVSITVISFAQGSKTLSLDLKGLTAFTVDSWQSTPINASFSVYDSAGNNLGTITSFATQDQIANKHVAAITLPDNIASVYLVPVAESLPSAYVFEERYLLDFSVHDSILYPVIVYAKSGFVQVTHTFDDGSPASKATFDLSSKDGSYSYTFTTTDSGKYTFTEPIPATEYTLYMKNAPMDGLGDFEPQSFALPVYHDINDLVSLSLQTTRISESDTQLSNVTATADKPAPSLIESSQEVRIQLAGFGCHKNSVPLSNYQFRVHDITLTDASNNVIPKSKIAIQMLTYNNEISNYLLSVSFIDGEGASIGETILLEPGDTAVSHNSQAVGFVANYFNEQTNNTILPSAFDGGTIDVTLLLPQYQPDTLQPEARGIHMDVIPSWVIDGTTNTFSNKDSSVFLSQSILPAQCLLNVSIHSDDQGNATFTLTNNGGLTLPAVPFDVVLPDGWRVRHVPSQVSIIRAIDSDALTFDPLRKLSPGESISCDLKLAKAETNGNASLYIKNIVTAPVTLDNPKGLLIQSSELVFNPLLGSSRGTTYAIVDVPCSIPTAFDSVVEGIIQSGCIYEDKNGNGILDDNETGIAGISIVLTNNHDNKLAYQALTDENGRFYFYGLDNLVNALLTFTLPDNLMISGLEETPLGYVFDGSNFDIPYTTTCSISGTVTDGAKGIGNVKVTVQMENGESVETTTDEMGTFAVGRLMPGAYSVSFTPSQEQRDIYLLAHDGDFFPVMLTDENKNATITETALLLGSLYLQVIGPARDEPISATLSTEGVLCYQASMNTSSGVISFKGVKPDTYTLSFELPATLILSPMAIYDTVTVTSGVTNELDIEVLVGSSIEGSILTSATDLRLALSSREKVHSELVVKDNIYYFSHLTADQYTLKATVAGDYYLDMNSKWSPNATGAEITLDLAQGETLVVPQLQFVKKGSVAGFIWNDSNGDASFTSNEPGIEDVEMTLEVLRNDSFQYVAKTQTNVDGSYLFEDVLPGSYRVHASLESSKGFVTVSNQSRFDSNGYTDVFTVSEAQKAEGISGGVVTSVEVTIAAFYDSSEDGVRGTYERDIPGVKVEVLAQDMVTIIAEGETNQDGLLSFKALAQGSYFLRFTLPENYAFTNKSINHSINDSLIGNTNDITSTSELITLGEGSKNQFGVGATKVGSLIGRAWYDANSNGIMDSDEHGQANVQISLVPKKTTDSTHSVITNSDGYYSFQGIRSGSYDLIVSAPEDVMFTRYSAVGRENRSIFTSEGMSTGSKLFEIIPGKKEDNINIGFVSDAVVSGIVFIDANYNGIKDENEIGLENAKLTIEKVATNDVVAQTTSDENGMFRFGSLRGNTYRIRAVLPDSNIVFSKIVDAPNANRMSERGISDGFYLGDAETLNFNVGTVYLGSISGVVYFDDNYTGNLTVDNRRASGLAVLMKNEKNETLQKVQTDKNGAYLFSGVLPGIYTIEMATARGSVFVIKKGTTSIISTTSAYGTTSPIVIEMADDVDGINGGLITPSTVKGFVYSDENDNGIQDESEGGYHGFDVILLNEHGEEFASTQTNASGHYTFANLMPGSYQVKYILKENERFGVNDEFSDLSALFSIQSGHTHTVPSVGALRYAKFSGTAFEDTNGNGTMDHSDALLANVTVTLTPSRNDLVPIVVSTDSQGLFNISHLRPDDYTLTVSLPSGMVFSKTQGCTYDDRTGKSSYQAPCSLAMGEEKNNYVISAVKPASISGQLWLDDNNDGIHAMYDRGLNNHTVTLYDELSEVEIANVTTDADGYFSFDNIIPSTYSVLTDVPDRHLTLYNDDTTMNFSEEIGILAQSNISVLTNDKYDKVLGGFVRLTNWAGTVLSDEGGFPSPLPGATLTLLDANRGTIAQVKSNEAGQYVFSDIFPQAYIIHVELPAGYLLVSPKDNSQRLETIIMADNSRIGESDYMTLVMGEDRTDLQILAVRPGSLGDTAWLDENHNGLQDTGERVIEGVHIAVLRDGNVIAEATTNAFGYYAIRDLYPSVYDIKITFPEGLKPTQKRTDIPLVASVLPENAQSEVVITGVEIKSNIHNWQFDFGFTLLHDNIYPEAVKDIKKQVWK